MQLIADLHIHSRYSRATSKDLDFVAIHRSALEKGIGLVATGDFTHPGWMQEIETQLEPAEQGLFKLKPELARQAEKGLPSACAAGQVRFVLEVEISNIYKKADRVRKNHNLVYVPSVEAAKSFTERLAAIGNVASDGRPILGLDARDLLEITLETDPQAFLIPAHIWTPWFSLLGSKSGFDSVQECFGDLSGHIFAAETGLSSDPPMNWRVSSLDRLTLVSNSDAHSAARLGREANLLDIELSYDTLLNALRTREGYLGTIEFFPEEGKYHLDGHRKCNLCLEPEKTREMDGRCPVCGGKLTVGVMSRVQDLADRPEGSRPDCAAPFVSLVPLDEAVGETLGVGASSKQVARILERLLHELGPELFILKEAPLEDIRRAGGAALSEAIRRIRNSELTLSAGYDGEYGKVHIFSPAERADLLGQTSFLAPRARAAQRPEADKSSAGGADPQQYSLLGGGLGQVREPSESYQAAAPQVAAPQAAATKPSAPQVNTEAHSGTTIQIATTPAHEMNIARQGNMERNVATQVCPERKTSESEEPLEGLDPGQLEAARTVAGPLLIVAGPGTGKTRTLVARIAHQIQSGMVDPARVLAISFTRQAAEELRERIGKMVPGATERAPRVTTFHGFGLDLLSEVNGEVPEIIDDETRQSLVAAAAGPDVSSRETTRAGRWISLAKQSVDPRAILEDNQRALFDRYEASLAERNALDIDDLVLKALHLLRDNPTRAQRVAERYASISVDEYQDVNDVQAELVRLLSPGGSTLCAIGDPNQAIYGFRGARPGHFGRFAETYPGARVVSLLTTYRLPGPVLKVAQATLGRSEGLKTCKEGPLVEVVACPSAKSEAEQIVVRLEKIVGGTSYFAVDSGRGEEAEDEGIGFGDVAILSRTRAQQSEILKALQRSAIPCRQVGEDEPHDPRSEKVAVMTMHAAKGREFQLVFVTGVEQGLLPLEIEGLETLPDEEQRLLYVAITRAKRRAVISYAARRTLFGKTMPGGPSPFIQDLPSSAITRSSPILPRRKTPSPQLSLF